MCLLFSFILVIVSREANTPNRILKNTIPSDNVLVWNETFEDQYEKRKQKMIHYCDKTLTIKSKYPSVPGFYHSPVGNFAVCRAPKTGTSFCGQFIMTLGAWTKNLNANVTNSYFNINRDEIHYFGRASGVQLKRNTIKDGVRLRRIIIGRNPYSRLYSSFVDKHFLLGALGSSLMQRRHMSYVVVNGKRCGYNVTFKSFLQQVTEDWSKGRLLNDHIRPITDMCNPCKIKYDFVASLETLSSDLHYFLSFLNLTQSNKMATSLLKIQWDKLTLKSLIKSHRNTHKKFFAHCPKFVDYLEKVWNTLKWQGSVHDSISYPREKLQNIGNNVSIDYLMSVFTNFTSSKPMTNEEKRTQRTRHLINAYTNIGATIIDVLKRAYWHDFHIFGYGMDPPNNISFI